MKSIVWLLLLTLSFPVSGQDNTSRDLSKKLNQQMEHPSANSPFSGKGLMGTGRTCSGYFLVKPKFIEWDTGIYECRSVLYKVLESKKNGNDIHAVYQLLNRPSKCPFEILTLDYTDHYVESIGKGWNLTSYTTYKNWKSNKWGVNCGLY